MSEVCPWLPDTPFADQNRTAINAIIDQVAQDFPASGANSLQAVEDGAIPPATMEWMWDKFMGVQHGSTEGWVDKIPLTRDLEPPYRPLVDQLRYGDFSFTQPSPPPAGEHFDATLVLGGMPHENTSRLLAAVDNKPSEANTDQIVMLAGQRLRWDTPTERSIHNIYQAIEATYPGADINMLRRFSRWLRAQEERQGSSEWTDPFATEYEMGRLCVEAVFMKDIDWKADPQPTIDLAAEPQLHLHKQKSLVIPPRHEVAVTYDLKDGRQVHVLNAKAVPRSAGVPRPTSDSQTREALELLNLEDNSSVLVSTGLPHVRAGLDVVTRLVDDGGPSIGKASITTSPWLPDKELVTALGEIPATHKADLRLRAALGGLDPDSEELRRL